MQITSTFSIHQLAKIISTAAYNYSYSPASIVNVKYSSTSIVQNMVSRILLEDRSVALHLALGYCFQYRVI